MQESHYSITRSIQSVETQKIQAHELRTGNINLEQETNSGNKMPDI